MKEFLIALIIGIVIIGVSILGSFGSGYISNIYKKTITKESVNIDRQIFEKSTSHVKGMADDLAKYKYELSKTQDEIERQAIIDLIIDRYADFNANDLNNPSLRNFLLDIREGRY